MKKLYLSIAILFAFCSSMTQAQEEEPLRISKAVAFAKSEPLNNLPLIISPDKAQSLGSEKEVKNKFQFEEWETPNAKDASQNVQINMGTKVSRGPVAGFSGQGATGSFPPDTDGDVSHEHFIQVVNSKYNIYSKDGTKLLGPLDLSTLWDNLPGPWNGTNDGDPIVLYDELADRWVITQFSVFTPTKYELFAISATSDPLGSYYLYAFSFDMMNDYPKLGVWIDGYYATYNMHNNGFQGARITVVERNKMLAGDPDAQMIEFHRSNQSSVMPADIDGSNLPSAGEPCPIMDIDNTTLQVKFYNFNTDWENPGNSSLTLAATINVTPFYYLDNTNQGVGGFVTQPGTTQKLDGLGNMIMNRLAYRKFDSHESMVVTHSVKVNSGSGVLRAAIRWYEFRKNSNNWELYQEGTYAPDDNHRWMGSAAMNALGDIAIGYSVSNSQDIFPSIRYTGRRAGDPLGQMTIEEVELKHGTSNQNHWRWGDYACMNVDPADDSTFWFTTEYNGWKTWIASFNLGEISAPVCYAGFDDTICSNNQFETQGSGTGVMSMQWTSSGDGFFSPNDQYRSTYIRGNQDVAHGGCTLYLEVLGFDSQQTSSDSLYLTIASNPVCDAGEDAEIQQGQSYTLQGTCGFPGSILWTTHGDGEFSNANQLNAIYTPGPNDIASGGVLLQLNAEAIPPCEGSDQDEIYLGIITSVHVIAAKLPNLKILPNPSHGIFELIIENLTPEEKLLYCVYNSQGKEVFRQYTSSADISFHKQLDMTQFANGFYFITFKNDRVQQTQKIIKQ